MSDLQKYQGELIERRADVFGEPAAGDSSAKIASGVLRRWYIVLLVFFVMCAVGIPAIWLGIKPLYSMTGAIRVAPIIPNILTGEADKGEISNYRSFVNTQAAMITSGNVVERVADELVEKNSSFFRHYSPDIKTELQQELKGTKTNREPAAILKHAINNEVIRAVANKNTELIQVTTDSTDAEEARQVVDAFIKNYMAIEGSSSAQDEDRNLRVLEDERKVLSDTLTRQRESIHQLAQEYGSTSLTGRQDMMLQRVAALLGELTKAEARRINLEAQIQLSEKTGDKTVAPEQLLSMRTEYINSSPIIQELNRNIVQLERELITAKQVLAPTNPVLEQKQKLIDALNKVLEQKRQEVSENFDKIAAEQISRNSEDTLANMRAEMEQVTAYENRLREKLSSEDNQTIEIGRKQLAIQDLQDQLALTKEMYDAISRRIKEVEMERKRPARISVAYNAEISQIRDKRTKYSVVLVFGSLFCGAALAFLLDKADKSLWTPEDVTKHIGIRIIGTTAGPETSERLLLPNLVVEDYQNIRANLGLLNGGGLPKKLVITSPSMRDGKTTCAINLASSISKSGKRVLLIDGDLRKPDIHRLLDIPKEKKSTQEMLLGKINNKAVYKLASTGLDVLIADSHENIDPYELLALPCSSQNMEKFSHNYDHVIIDSPPVLAFPDALIWAKMADAAILTSLAGWTTAPDLKEAKNKLTELHVKILGVVLSNVSAGHHYYRYGYDYYTQAAGRKQTKRVDAKLLLMPHNQQDIGPDIPKF
jgi:capsular exopolysaccharide synthesis family protein